MHCILSYLFHYLVLDQNFSLHLFYFILLTFIKKVFRFNINECDLLYFVLIFFNISCKVVFLFISFYRRSLCAVIFAVLAMIFFFLLDLIPCDCIDIALLLAITIYHGKVYNEPIVDCCGCERIVWIMAGVTVGSRFFDYLLLGPGMKDGMVVMLAVMEFCKQILSPKSLDTEKFKKDNNVVLRVVQRLQEAYVDSR